jgi:hypothetical protein
MRGRGLLGGGATLPDLWTFVGWIGANRALGPIGLAWLGVLALVGTLAGSVTVQAQGGPGLVVMNDTDETASVRIVCLRQASEDTLRPHFVLFREAPTTADSCRVDVTVEVETQPTLSTWAPAHGWAVVILDGQVPGSFQLRLSPLRR